MFQKPQVSNCDWHQLSPADTEIDVNADNFWELVLPEEKTPERLHQKLLKGGYIDTAEDRTAFLVDVHVLVKEAIAAWEKGDIINTSPLIQLLRSCKQYPQFNEDQQLNLQEWLTVCD